MLFSPDSLFEVASDAWISYRELDTLPGQTARYVRPNTLAADRRQADALKLFFSGMRLDQIHWYNLKAYQEARSSGREPFLRYRRPQDAKSRHTPDGAELPPLGKTPCHAKAPQVNQETNFLRRLKILAGCWTPEDQKLFQNLQEDEPEIPRALTAEEQLRWLEVARSNPLWETVYLYSLVAFDTCCSPNELRMLRLGDLKLNYQMISVPWPAAKNKARHREIVIENPDCEWAIQQLIERARSLAPHGAPDPVLNPTAHLFPFGGRKRGEHITYDFTRPMSSSGLKKRWQEVREASGLRWFRVEDTRHTGATRLAEAGVSADIICARMGHVRPEMRLHYTHISEAATRRQLRQAALAQRKPVVSVQPIYHDDATYRDGTMPADEQLRRQYSVYRRR